MKGSLYTIFYAVVLGVVCALILTGVGQFTAPYRKANAKAEEIRNILGVLEAPFEADASAAELLEVFKGVVEEGEYGNLTVYKYVEDGPGSEPRAVAIPFAGPGLWGPIKGFLALEPDMKTIRGITFHEQEETPGLGGEIGAEWFRNQFKGKSIYDEDDNPGIFIRKKGEASGINEVDGITGATMTCDKVQAMLNAAIEEVSEGVVKGG